METIDIPPEQVSEPDDFTYELKISQSEHDRATKAGASIYMRDIHTSDTPLFYLATKGESLSDEIVGDMSDFEGLTATVEVLRLPS